MDLVVIGGSAAGLKAACRAARLLPDARVRVIVQSPWFAYSACGLPYLLSGDIDDFNTLVKTPDGLLKDVIYFREVKRVEILAQHRAERIDRAARIVHCTNLANGQQKAVSYHKLVIAAGSTPASLTVAGADLPGVFAFSGPDDVIQTRRELESGLIKRVAIIGGGVIGLELCEAFTELWGIEVELIELSQNVLAGLLDGEVAALIEDELRDRGIGMRLGRRCVECRPSGGRIQLTDNKNGTLIVDRVINATGFRSNSALAREAGLEIGLSGGISVDEHLRTSDPDIYAAGDCVELPSAVSGQHRPWSLGSLATRMGRVAADNLAGGDSVFGPVAGTTILKVFDLNVGATGLTAHECERRSWDIECSWGAFYDRMHYYPEAQFNCYKMVCDASNGRLLGLQAVGKGNLLHILDKASQAVQKGARRSELWDLEQAYAPPYNQAVDPLAYLAFIIENSRFLGVEVISPGQNEDFFNGALILDVRSDEEVALKPITGANDIIHIPLISLRRRLNELPRDRKIILFCQTGSRAYEGALILRQAGFSKAGFLAGGALFQTHSNVEPAER